MSIDKFGRYNPCPRLIRGPVCQGIDLMDDGDVDIQYKRLCNVADAVFEEDAVNLNTLKEICFCQNDDIHYHAISRKIINLASPKLPADATTKAYVDEKLPVITDGICDLNGYKLSNIGYPETSTNTVYKEFILNEIKNILFHKTNNEVDFKKLRIINIAIPLDMTDTVNKEYLFERLNLFRDNIYRILYIYIKTTNDKPINKEDWTKEYL